VGSRRDCPWILGVSGFRVVAVAEEAESDRLTIRIARRGVRRYACSGCWDRTRVKRQPRPIGLDTIQRGKGQRFWTVLTDVVHGEVIGLRRDRSEATATAWLAKDLTGRQRGAITAVCTDRHRRYLDAAGAAVPNAEIVFDTFHVLQHASAALDEVRRREFFRAGPAMREHGRGTRWLLMRRWKTSADRSVRNSKTLFAANRRLFKADVRREPLDRLWTYKTRPGVLNVLMGSFKALRWQRLPELERLGDFLLKLLKASLRTAIITFASVSSSP
jgi:transposase